MTLIDQIRADREAGTDGPWGVVGDGTKVKPQPSHMFFVPIAETSEEVRWDQGKGTWVIIGHAETNARRISRVPDLEEIALAAADLLAALECLIADSDGVYGLHQNGDPAPWDELCAGGRFEEWLEPAPRLRTLLEGEK